MTAAERRKAYSVRHALAGLCDRCSRPALPEHVLCEVCRAKQLLYSRAKQDRLRPERKRLRCARCGELGHYARACTAESRRSA